MTDKTTARPTVAEQKPTQATAEFTATSGASQQAGRTIIIDVPASTATLGLGPIISALLLFGAWMVVGIGYICVPGSLVGAVAGIVLGFMNVGNGLAAAALCFGCGIACIGLCAPIFYGTRFLHGLVKRQSKDMFAQASGK